MKIEFETKYNIGDVLYHATKDFTITKVTVTQIGIEARGSCPLTIQAKYKFSDNKGTYELSMYDYFDTPEEAGQYLAKIAVKNMKEK